MKMSSFNHPLVGSACVILFLTLLSPGMVVHSAPVAVSAPVNPDKIPGRTQGKGLGSMVQSLLSSLLKETLYSRMESLLLDHHPGRRTDQDENKRRIVETAVHNYNQQDMTPTGELPENFTKLAGKKKVDLAW